MMKKILVNGAAYTEIPLILEAKEMGFFVIVTGKYDNPLGSKYADKYIEADYSNKEEIFNIVIQEKIDVIVPGANDASILVVSYISEKLNIGNFDNYEVSKIIHYKDLFKKFALTNHLNVPKGYDLNSKNIIYPIIVKPIDMSGGKGTSVVYKEEELEKAINFAMTSSRNKKLIIEQYIDGEHFSSYLLIKNQKVIFDFFALEYFYISKFMVAGAHSTFKLSVDVKSMIINDIEKMASILELVDGLVHVQFIVSNNKPYILEVTRRPPGGLFSILVDYTKNVNSAKEVLKAYIGKEINILNSSIEKYIIRHCVMSDKNGMNFNIEYADSIKEHIINKFIVASSNSIENYLVEMPEVVFFEVDNEDECMKFVNNFDKLIKFKES